MNVFLFPGQGSQEIGMGAELFRDDAEFCGWVARASELTGADLKKICLRGPERSLVRTKYLQPLLVCVSLGLLRHLTRAGVEPQMVLGHSLGEISALAAAGIASFETAIDIAVKRGAAMDAAASGGGGMLAVVFQEREPVLKLISETAIPGIVVANDNSTGQLILSGDVQGLAQASELITERRLARCVRLPVAGAWHSPQMEPARREFEAWLESVELHAPRLPLLFNVTAQLETDPLEIRRLLGRNLVAPLQWRPIMETLKHNGPHSFFEVGPGRVLSGLVRANGFGDEHRIFNINNLRGIQKAVESGEWRVESRNAAIGEAGGSLSGFPHRGSN